jgi:AraC-like DNA-binding protein
LLLDLMAESSTQSNDAYYPIRKGIDALGEEWNKNERIEKYADLCGVSATYFYRCFRRWSGKSPVEYRNTLRLSNAESLLRCTDMRIGEISELVGFEDPFYFCRLFRERFGASPQGYRKRTREGG